MELFWKRIKTEQSTNYAPLSQFYHISQREATGLTASKRTLSSKILSARTQKKLTPKGKGIREENIRLISKLMEIHCRKPKAASQQPISPPKKRENTQREREITIQNQRLGRSLVRIKSGKSVDRVKTDIARSLAKLNKKKKKALQQNRQATLQTNPENDSLRRNLCQLSKCENLPKKLTRARAIGAAELLEFKKSFF